MNFPAPGLAARGLAIATLVLMSSAAFAAPDAKKVADDLVAAVQVKRDAKATYDSTAASGDDVVITNFKVVPRDGDAVTVPSLVVSSPVDRTGGGFTAASIAFDGGNASGTHNKLSWDKGIAQNVVVQTAEEMRSNTKTAPFSHLEVTKITASNETTPEPVTVASVSFDLGNIVDGVPNDGTVKISGIEVPGASLKADEQTAVLVDQLGYQKLNLDVLIDASYDASKDSLQMKSVTLDGKDMGKLAITGTFGGLPRAKLEDPKKLRDVVATATVDAATVRFDNQGLVERILDMQAKAMGATRDQFVDQITGALPLMLSMINNPGFQDKVATAATAFLKDPKSLTVKLAPANPVPVMQIMGAARAAPQTVPDILAVDIKAND